MRASPTRAKVSGEWATLEPLSAIQSPVRVTADERVSAGKDAMSEDDVGTEKALAVEKADGGIVIVLAHVRDFERVLCGVNLDEQVVGACRFKRSVEERGACDVNG